MFLRHTIRRTRILQSIRLVKQNKIMLRRETSESEAVLLNFGEKIIMNYFSFILRHREAGLKHLKLLIIRFHFNHRS